MIEAEKFRAKITEPTGTIADPLETELNDLVNNPEEITLGLNVNKQPLQAVAGQPMREGLLDDDFLHLTCHIDLSLHNKIERGDFVDLEKLLPKDRFHKKFADEARLEWVHRDGSTFLVPATDKDVKITNVQRWEQAFRVYATIYTGVNPH